ncbi:MAG: universal stress protein [Acetobacteraceae bacterium]|nr:universal stress protein [Acetobacteraceae bacterium]
MSHFILLPATGQEYDAPVFVTALAAARLLDGHLAFLHVRPDLQRQIAGSSAGDFGLGTSMDNTFEEMENDADAREQAAVQIWKDFCDRNGVTLADQPCGDGVSAEWMNEAGDLNAWLVALGRTADLIVTGRGGDQGEIDLRLLEGALMETGRPVLIATENPPDRLEDIVAIAWSDTPEAAGAVGAAMPFIRRASQVTVLVVEEPTEGEDRSSHELLRVLRWHNPKVRLEHLSRNGRPQVDVLFDAVTKAKATLLVMGGYGHAPLREAVFGGVTRSVLQEAPVPVLIAH